MRGVYLGLQVIIANKNERIFSIIDSHFIKHISFIDDLQLHIFALPDKISKIICILVGWLECRFWIQR